MKGEIAAASHCEPMGHAPPVSLERNNAQARATEANPTTNRTTRMAIQTLVLGSLT